MKAEDHEQDIEIEYKEFPKSEFLEIRKKSKSETERAEVPGKKDRKKKRILPDTAPSESASGEQARSIKQEAGGAGQGVNKKSLLIFLAGLLTAGILVGVYYFLKLLF